uniref:Si:dkey-85k7.11 n=1 Tax=Electrophorus electricus TaxID=8005 RepID=A0A4W4G892_ELEEL
MSPTNVICLLSFFLLAGLRVAGASASDSFKECRQFLYMRTPPAGIQGTNMKRICQRYGDKPRYATLYDSSHGQGRMDTPWMYEPQLATVEDSPNMQILPPSGKLDPLLEESQALLEDYFDAAAYERGALNPDQHQAESQDKAATYTLTNVVPQITDFTKGSWEAYIDRVRRRLNNFCRGVAYMVTGVTISGVTIRRGGQDRLAVPKHLWSAYCCPRYERNSPYEVRYMFPSYGAYGLNDMMDHDVVEVPLRTLENFLQSQTGTDRNVSIFLKGCISENTFKRKKR